MSWKRGSVGLLACGALAFAACTEDVTSPTPTDEAAPEAAFKVTNSSALQDGKYLVMFKKSGIPAGFAGEVEGLGGVVEFTHDVGLATVSGLSAKAAAALAKNRAIGAVEANTSFDLDPLFDAANVESVGASPASAGDPTTAYFYARQWNMRAIGADMAWAAGRTGSAAVTLAILDSGIDYQYFDLVGRVDLSRSASFIPQDDALVDIFFPGTNYVTDLNFHGTHVASTAVSNSDVIAGVTTETTLIGVKVCNVNGSCPFDAVIAGILHAVDNGADIINMSLGGGFAKAGNGRYVGIINKLFNYARSAGVTMVVSAGNEAIDLDHAGNLYKTYCDTPNTICVSATGPTAAVSTNGPWTDVDALAPYSNYGRSAINVAAPGGTGPVPGGAWVYAGCSTTSLLIPVCGTDIYVLGVNGTSMSAPHVSGLAALMVENYGRNPGRIKAAIQQSADDLGQPGTDPYYGKGRINVGTAVGAN
jgi:hypothetical protein